MAPRDSKTATPEAIQALAEDNLTKTVRIQQLEAMIQGLMDAMKPLLDEWKAIVERVSEDTP